MSQNQTWKAEGGEEDDVQMPLGVGDGGQAEESFEEKRPRMNTSTLALVAAFAAALIALYMLGLQNKPRTASAEQQARQKAVDSAIEEMLKNGDKNAQVRSFLDDTSKLVLLIRQYLEPVAESADLVGNPFERELPRTAAVGAPEPVSVLPKNNEDAKELRETAEEFAGLKLQTTMMSKNPAALISNKLVTVGTKFKHLTVTEIQPGRVLLTGASRTFELKSSAPTIDKP